MAVATRRVPWAARAVAVTGAMDFALYDDAVAVVAVMAVDEQGEECGDEEEDDVPGLTISKLLKSLCCEDGDATYMIPNAQLALSIAHCLSTLYSYLFPDIVTSPKSVL
jgi:hypothetical protein